VVFWASSTARMLAATVIAANTHAYTRHPCSACRGPAGLQPAAAGDQMAPCLEMRSANAVLVLSLSTLVHHVSLLGAVASSHVSAVSRSHDRPSSSSSDHVQACCCQCLLRSVWHV
jgi:hypothetical protein